MGGSRRQVAQFHGAVGPVEAEGSGTVAVVPPAAAEPSTAAPNRTRVAMAVLAGVLLLTVTPERLPTPPPPLPPWPSQAVTVSYQGPSQGAGPSDGVFRARLLISVIGGPPVTVTALSEEYSGMVLVPTPAPPLEIRQGRPRTVEVGISVIDCGVAPRGLSLPFLNVTLRNTRAIQTESEILGDKYAHDLSVALLRQCHPSGHRGGVVP